MPMHNSGRPMQEDFFSLPESLNFGEPARHYGAPTSFTDHFTSPHQPFDYLSQASFSSPAEEHRQTMPVQPPASQFDPWASSFRPNLFDYNTATTQTMPPPSMSYQMPMPATQDLPHHGPRTPHMDSMALKTPTAYMMPPHHV